MRCCFELHLTLRTNHSDDNLVRSIVDCDKEGVVHNVQVLEELAVVRQSAMKDTLGMFSNVERRLVEIWIMITSVNGYKSKGHRLL